MMSKPKVNPAPLSLASPTDPKASQIDANLKHATENVQPIRLRRTLQELRQTRPDPHKVTAALLLATQQKYIEKIRASKVAQSEEEVEDEDDEDDTESGETSDVGEISELSSEEVEDEEDSDDGSDDGMKRSELGSEEEDDGTDEERASTTTSTQHINIKRKLREKE